MRRHHALFPLSTFAAVLLTASLLTGCGGETASEQRPNEPAPSSVSRSDQEGGLDHTVVDIVSATAAGGDVDNLATVLDADSAVADFTEQFEGHTLATQVGNAANRADTPPGQVLVGAVISIGCDVPPGVTVTSTDSGVVITPKKVLKPLKECFAAVTTVALVNVDADAV